jgi:hypothetical protein
VEDNYRADNNNVQVMEASNDGQEQLRALFDQCKEASHDFINIEGLGSLWQKLG